MRTRPHCNKNTLHDCSALLQNQEYTQRMTATLEFEQETAQQTPETDIQEKFTHYLSTHHRFSPAWQEYAAKILLETDTSQPDFALNATRAQLNQFGENFSSNEIKLYLRLRVADQSDLAQASPQGDVVSDSDSDYKTVSDQVLMTEICIYLKNFNMAKILLQKYPFMLA